MAPHPQAAGRSPHPLKAASVSAETLLPASGGAASKGDQSPFEEPPALRGDERNHFRKVIDYEKNIKFSTRMASADREKIRALAAKAHMSMSDYVTACCLGKRIVVIDE